MSQKCAQDVRNDVFELCTIISQWYIKIAHTDVPELRSSCCHVRSRIAAGIHQCSCRMAARQPLGMPTDGGQAAGRNVPDLGQSSRQARSRMATKHRPVIFQNGSQAIANDTPNGGQAPANDAPNGRQVAASDAPEWRSSSDKWHSQIAAAQRPGMFKNGCQAAAKDAPE